jgi:tRNA (mo5U34)-methyltransferase
MLSHQALAQRVASFPYWHYEFDLNGVRTPVVHPSQINRNQQRRRHVFDALLGVTGGNLAGKRVLDLGCNAGYWALEAIKLGADFVLGIDGREMHIEQAELVFEVNDIDPSRYEFATGNVFGFPYGEHGPFDVVLCLGLLYHVSKPLELFEAIEPSNTDLLVVETNLARRPGSYFQLRREPLDHPLNAIDHETVFLPTRGAVQDLARQFGYEVVTLRPEFTSWEGAEDYRARARRAFLCSKRTSINGAGLAVEPAGGRSIALDMGAVLRTHARELADRIGVAGRGMSRQRRGPAER